MSGTVSAFLWSLTGNKDQSSTRSIGSSKKEEPIRGNKPFKCFILLTGKTLNSHHMLMDRLKRKVPDLQVVQTEAECDIILVFCPVIRGPEHDIKAALGKLNDISDTKPAVLVVLHHTFDAEYVASDSSRAVSRGNTIMVNCLFHEDLGLLQCQKNEESIGRIVTHITPQIQRIKSAGEKMEIVRSCGPTAYTDSHSVGSAEHVNYSKNKENIKREQMKRKHSGSENTTLKYFILLTGRTLNTEEIFMSRLKREIPQLQQVSTVDQCDVILAFCPIVSRAGTDIEAAVRKLNQESADKPAFLVVLHRTFNPEHVVPDSSRSVRRENTVTVDCLFCEDQGLLQCRKNQESLTRIINYIKAQIQSVQSKEENMESHETGVAAKKTCKYFVLMGENTPDSFMDKLEKMSDLKEVTSEHGCHFILTFCRDVSQDRTDFRGELKKPESSSEHDYNLKRDVLLVTSANHIQAKPDVENEPMDAQEEGGASQYRDKLENRTSKTTPEIQLLEKERQLELRKENNKQNNDLEENNKEFKESLPHMTQRHLMREHLREITRAEKKLKEVKAELDYTIRNLEQKKYELQFVSKLLSDGIEVFKTSKSQLDSMEKKMQEENKQIQEIIHPEFNQSFRL